MSYQQSYSTQEFTYEEQTTTTSYQRVGDQEPTYQVQHSSYHSQQQSSSLSMTIHSATNLKNVETLGKQDPYVRFSYDFSDSKSWQQTFVAKDAGQNATWNQTFQLAEFNGASDLFIEVMDEEKGNDELIGFAAIPLRQITQGQTLSTGFQIYTIKSEVAGEVQMTFSTESQQQQGGQPQGSGQSYVHEGHLKRCKSLRNKGIAVDVASVAVGGALAVGAGLLGKKLFDDHKKEEQEEAEEAERQKQEHEKFEKEKASLEAEKKKFQQDQEKEKQDQDQEQHHQKKDCEPKKECEPKKKDHCEPKKKECEPKKKECEPKKKDHCEPKKKECEPKKKDHCEPKKKDHCDSKKKDHCDSKKKDHCDSKKKDHCDSKKKDHCEPKKKDHCEPKKKDHCDSKKKSNCGASTWNPVGTYSPGDRVEYHGKTYLCLQGHTSNPTWMPGAAHSLWQPE